MNPRLKIKLTLSDADKVLEILGWLLLIVLWIIVIAKYSALPEIIPTHYDAAGNTNDTGPKATIFLFPAIATVLFISMTLLSKYPHIFNFPRPITESNARRQYAPGHPPDSGTETEPGHCIRAAGLANNTYSERRKCRFAHLDDGGYWVAAFFCRGDIFWCG